MMNQYEKELRKLVKISELRKADHQEFYNIYPTLCNCYDSLVNFIRGQYGESSLSYDDAAFIVEEILYLKTLLLYNIADPDSIVIFGYKKKPSNSNESYYLEEIYYKTLNWISVENKGRFPNPERVVGLIVTAMLFLLYTERGISPDFDPYKGVDLLSGSLYSITDDSNYITGRYPLVSINWDILPIDLNDFHGMVGLFKRYYSCHVRSVEYSHLSANVIANPDSVNWRLLFSSKNKLSSFLNIFILDNDIITSIKYAYSLQRNSDNPPVNIQSLKSETENADVAINEKISILENFILSLKARLEAAENNLGVNEELESLTKKYVLLQKLCKENSKAFEEANNLALDMQEKYAQAREESRQLSEERIKLIDDVNRLTLENEQYQIDIQEYEEQLKSYKENLSDKRKSERETLKDNKLKGLSTDLKKLKKEVVSKFAEGKQEGRKELANELKTRIHDKVFRYQNNDKRVEKLEGLEEYLSNSSETRDIIKVLLVENDQLRQHDDIGSRIDRQTEALVEVANKPRVGTIVMEQNKYEFVPDSIGIQEQGQLE